MNLSDLLILGAIACAVVLALRQIRKRNKSGCSCCDGCAGKACCRTSPYEKN